MSVFANGRATDRFFAADGSPGGRNQIDQNFDDPNGTTLAVLFDQHPLTHTVDVGVQGDFTALTPITLNTVSTIPGYSEDTQVTYASQVLPYQITQRTLATPTLNCVIMELAVRNTGSASLTGGRLLFMMDVDAAHTEIGDTGGYDPAKQLLYVTDFNSSGQTTLPGFGVGVALLQGELAGYRVNGDVTTYGTESYPTSDVDIKAQMIAPPNTITDGDNAALWLVATIPTLTQNQETMLVFSICAKNAMFEEDVDDDLIDDQENVVSLAATKTATPAAGSAGQPMTYTISLLNNGLFYIDDVILTDTLPASVTLVDYSVSQGSIVADNGLITATIGRIYPSSEPVLITLAVIPSSSLPDGAIITNQAFISSALFYTSTNVASYEIAPPLLTVTKEAAPEPVEAGEELLYTINLKNEGQGDAFGVVVSDTTPVNTTFIPDSVAITPASPGSVIGSPPLLVQNLTVRAGTEVTVTYRVRTGIPLPNGTLITNTVAITAPGIPAPVNAAVTSSISSTPGLKVNKFSTYTGPLLPGKTITYTILVTNNGNENATNGLVFDPLPANTNFVNGSIKLDPESAGTQGLTPPTLASGLTIGPGQQVTVTYQVTLAQPITTGTIITNQVTVSSTEALTAATAIITDQVTAADLAINKFSQPVPALPGQIITYTIIVNNLGQTTVANALVSDLIPDQVDNVVWQCVHTAGGVCTAGGTGDINDTITLPAGGSLTYTVTGTLAPDTTTTLTNTATVTAPAGVIDQTPANNTDTDINTPLVIPVLLVNKTGPPDPLSPGQTITYTIVVANEGSVALTDGLLTDPIPANTTFVEGSLTLTPSNAGQLGPPPALVSNLTIPAGQAVTLTFAVVLTNPVTNGTMITNTATLSSPQMVNPAGDTVTNTVISTPTLQIIKTGPAQANIGDTLIFTFTVSNIGTTLLQNLLVEDTLAAPVFFVGGDNGDGILDLTETWLYTAAYTVSPTALEQLVNIGTVTANDPGGSQAVATDTHTTLIEFNPALQLTKQGPVTASINIPIIYTFTVSHAGLSDGSPVGNLILTDTIAGLAVYQSGDDGDDLLEAGETWTFTASYTPLFTDTNPLINVGLVQGFDPNSDVITATDSHQTLLKKYNPILNLVKNGPATASVGANVVFTFTVSHNLAGDRTPVGNLSITDTIAGPAAYVSGDDGNNFLDDGESWLYSVNYVIKPTDPNPLQNTATVSGRDLENDPISASGSHTTTLFGFAPVLFVDKDGPAQAPIGSTIIYTLTVINYAANSLTSLSKFDIDPIEIANIQPGDGSPISITSVIDEIAGPPIFVGGDTGGQPGMLDAGEGWVYIVNYTVPPSDNALLINRATVSGLDQEGDRLRAQAAHTTTLQPSSRFEYFLPLIFKRP